MLLAVSFSGLILATILVIDVHSICLLSRPCQCGTSGKSYKRCFETLFQQYSCESWVNCQTCEDYNEFCVTCPPGFSGLTCRNEVKAKRELSCKHHGVVENGIIEDFQSETEQFPVGTRLKFLCREGYEREGPEAIYCLRNLSWSEDPPVCKLIFSITKRKRDLHQQRRDTSSATGKECTFRITGDISFNCTTNKDGKVSCDVNCNDKCQGTYHCVPGIGWDRTLPSCEATKEPHVFPMRKEKVTCPDPGAPKDGGRRNLDGKHIPSRYTFKIGDVVVFFCNDKKATLQGGSRLTCKLDATWDGILPLCVTSQKEEKIKPKMSCKHPGVVENGIIEDFQSETEQFPAGTILKFICRDGYERDGPEAIYCLRNLSWSEDPPVCKLTLTTTVSTPTSEPSCIRPGIIENGFIQNDVPEMQSFPVGTVLSFKCMEGYELVGARDMYCLRSVGELGYWSDVPPVCRYISTTTTSRPIEGGSCQNPGMVENGIFENYPPETVSFHLGTSLKFRCIEGYKIEGSEYIYCITPGKWLGSLPKCRLIPTAPALGVSCGHPGLVVNGVFEGMSQSRFPLGTSLTIRCRPGTRMEGEKTINCLLTGEWSASLPICRPTRKEPEKKSQLDKMCEHPGMIENGVTEPSVSNSEVFAVGEQLKFKCKEGYSMVGSDTVYCESSGKWSSAPPRCRRSKNIPDCGRVFQETYKSSGKHIRSDWPWTVALSTANEDDVEKVTCGGALLNSRTVLTAAHCVTKDQNIKLHFDSRRPVSEQVRKISRLIIHPDYDDVTHANDIALMKFDHHVYYDPRTQPICLPTPTLNSSGKNLLPGKTTFVTGYRLEFASNQSSTPAFKVFELPVQSAEVCDPVCRDQELVSCSPNTFCAGYLKDTKECIYGGTPLVVHHKEKSRYTLEGLVTRAESARDSWSGRCKHAESYTTFTNVTHFMPFILENLN